MSEDLDARGELDERAKWGEDRMDRMARKVLDRLERVESDRDDARDAIVALRARVKALEDRVP